MVNRDFLVKEIRNKTRLANDLNITRMCLWRKLKGVVEFTESEIDKLVKIYGEDVIR